METQRIKASYKKLWKLVINKGMMKKLREQVGVTMDVIAKMGKRIVANDKLIFWRNYEKK